MKIAHSVLITVFSNEGEDSEKIKEGLIKLIGLDLEKEKIKLEHEAAEGAAGNKIEIFKIKLEKERHVNSFLKDIISKLNQQQKELLTKQVETRVDDECNFFLRIDKEKFFEGRYWITDRGNCYHIKTLIAAYPANKEKAVDIVKKHILV
jgi:RNA binding exosome subunit